MTDLDLIMATLEACAEYMDARSDVVDGDYGQPEANTEMSLLTELEQAMSALKSIQMVVAAPRPILDPRAMLVN